MHKAALLASLAALVMAAPVTAATFAFSGSFTNTNPPAAAGGRCAVLTVSIGNIAPFIATGTSTLGAFTSTQSHCLDSGPPVAVGAADVPYVDGLFTYSFAGGDTLSGTYTGLLSNSGTFGQVDNVQDFLVTGGTGTLTGATGSFLGTGRLSFGNGPPSATLTISDGVISVAGVPEPATWTMLIIGFAVAGIALRRRPAGAGQAALSGGAE